MADITNPQVIKFCNNRLRPACDRVMSAIRTLQECRIEYVAQGIGPLVAGDAQLQASTVQDGSATDGRNILLGYDVDNAAGGMQALLDWAAGAGASSVNAMIKPSVNSQPVF